MGERSLLGYGAMGTLGFLALGARSDGPLLRTRAILWDTVGGSSHEGTGERAPERSG